MPRRKPLRTTATTPAARVVQLHTGLRERGFGTFEGQTWADIETHWPEESRRWRQRDPHFAPPGGETPLQLRERVAATVNAIAVQHLGQQIVLVAHGGVLDMLYRPGHATGHRRPPYLGTGQCRHQPPALDTRCAHIVGWADTRHFDDGALDEISA